MDLASICLPELLVEFRKKINPQEEKKEEPTLKDTLTESVAHFCDIVTKVEQETDKKLLKLQTEIDELEPAEKLKQLLVGNKFAQNVHYQNIECDYKK